MVQALQQVAAARQLLLEQERGQLRRLWGGHTLTKMHARVFGEQSSSTLCSSEIQGVG